jgi:hypothetical protein
VEPETCAIYLCSCCSHLEQRASVKRFVSRQFLNLKTVSRPPCTGDQPVTRPLPTQDNTNRMNAVGFESTIPVFKRAKTFHALDCEATVIGGNLCNRNVCVVMDGFWALTMGPNLRDVTPFSPVVVNLRGSVRSVLSVPHALERYAFTNTRKSKLVQR